MAINHVVWEPKTGGAGDGRFNIEGAEQLSGAAPDNPQSETPLVAGDSSLYSTKPTMAQINGANSEGANQLVAYVRRQIENLSEVSISQTLPLNLFVPAYIVADAGYSHYVFADGSVGGNSLYLRSHVDKIRTAWGLPAFTWLWNSDIPDSDIQQNAVPTRGNHMTEIRQALEPEGILDLMQQSFSLTRGQHLRETIVTNTGRGAPATGGTMRAGIDRTGSGGGGTGLAYRSVLYFYIPEWLDDVALVNDIIFSGTLSSVSGSPGSIGVYLCTNTNQPNVAADFNAVGALLGSFAASSPFSVSIPIADVVVAAGGLLKLIIMESVESGWATLDPVVEGWVEFNIASFAFEIDLV